MDGRCFGFGQKLARSSIPCPTAWTMAGLPPLDGQTLATYKDSTRS